MKNELVKLLIETLENKLIGYKVMSLIDGMLVSGANHKLKYKPEVGSIMTMGGNGIYMSTNKDYVLDYYSGLGDDEVLISFEFNPRQITFGNLTDKDVEIAVNSAKIINLEKI